MSKFYVCKYPVNYFGKENLPVGTIFTIASIGGSCFELQPIKKVSDLTGPIQVDPGMLAQGFTEQDHVDE